MFLTSKSVKYVRVFNFNELNFDFDLCEIHAEDFKIMFSFQ